ncbi:SsgA family sporulation/cell division regulator [Kitasatospora sp. NPDC059795]|uniref:SsgA family sporulation/cell division regulator n=1 Tax=Kitasatospora sp. NPDC059795 TaxID=3346949 RepID=UPI003654395E
MPVATSRSTAVTLPEGPFPHVALSAQLRFEASLPYGVCLAFPSRGPQGETLEWHFGRDLLAEGRLAPAGDGDVRVEPGPDGRVLVTLSPHDAGRTVVSVPAKAVAAFLADAFALVPPGTESEHLDLDAVLAQLFP